MSGQVSAVVARVRQHSRPVLAPPLFLSRISRMRKETGLPGFTLELGYNSGVKSHDRSSVSNRKPQNRL